MAVLHNTNEYVPQKIKTSKSNTKVDKTVFDFLDDVFEVYDKEKVMEAYRKTQKDG